jgi:hypothetical protein
MLDVIVDAVESLVLPSFSRIHALFSVWFVEAASFSWHLSF